MGHLTRLSFLFLLAALAGCGSSTMDPGPYAPGLKREELALPGAAIALEYRPASGWETVQGTHEIGKAVLAFERQHPGTAVERCEVYWSDRRTSVSFVQGVYWDYLFFDRDNRLLGSWRRLVD